VRVAVGSGKLAMFHPYIANDQCAPLSR